MMFKGLQERLNVVTEETIQAMTRDIVAALDPEQVILFGSYARNQASDDSDVDLIIVMRKDAGEKSSRPALTAHLYSQLSHYRVPKDLLIYTSDDFHRLKHWPKHVVREGVLEGRQLYTRG